MILNAYAVLDAFLSLLRLMSGLLVVGLATMAWAKGAQKTISPEIREGLEARGSLLFLLAFLLVGLNLVSWPVLYLLLLSYVPQWPGVMCIYGVTQIGAGSLGPSRFLPELLKTLEVTKPALVFIGGAWFVLYLINRRTATAPLYNRVVLGLIALGVLATADAAVEGAYLVIPKKEKFLAAGCCAEAFDSGGRSSKFLPQALSPENSRPVLYACYYGMNVGLGLALLVAGRWLKARKASSKSQKTNSKSGWSPFGIWDLVLGILLMIALLAIPISGIFLIDIAAPTLLHLPYHHCPYDLVPDVPESIFAVALFLGATFCVGWACVAAWFGRSPETWPFLADWVGRIMVLGAGCYLASLVIMSLELALA
jgi:hypothetical protein